MKNRKFGWLPDYPDMRDHTLSHKNVKPLFEKMKIENPVKEIPESIDLRNWCSPVEDQGELGSCTANAGTGIVEYCERKAFGKHLDASRLFLYKTTRNLMKEKGDTGAFLRSTMGALALFGVPPEDYYPYNIKKFDEEPPAFCYAFAQNYQALEYVRLDPPNTTPEDLLGRIKTNLAAGLPAIFGFTVYSSIYSAEEGKIPYPCKNEKVAGGHAVMAAGYDDAMKIKSCREETTGALLIRNSWGSDWGDEGYGWLPYDYVLNGLATDWWTLLKEEWVDTGEFQL